MKLDGYEINRSSFLSVQNDLRLIVEKMLRCDRLTRLLYYTDKDCLKKPKLNQEQIYSLVNKEIQIVPWIPIDKDRDMKSFVVITMDNFMAGNNPEFRDCTISFDIISHIDLWNLGDYQLRPILIAGEIDNLFNKKRLTGIGTLEFVACKQNILDRHLSGYELIYKAYHGTDDKINMNG